MTDLTEQWKKGELPKGEEYWVILTGEWYLQNPVKPVRAFYSCDCEFEGYLDDDIKEVLAPVPSYEQWQAKLEENKNLYKMLDVLSGKLDSLLKEDEENEKLKEQLESENLAKNEGAEIVAELQSKVKKYEELWYEANRRICMLTGLLVEVKECVEENLEFSKSIGRNRIKPRNKGLLKRIEKALKG